MDDKFRKQLEECGADVETTLKRFMNNDAIYQKFLGKFPNDPNYANLGTNLEAGAFEEAYKCAHALKGVVGNLKIQTHEKRNLFSFVLMRCLPFLFFPFEFPRII